MGCPVRPLNETPFYQRTVALLLYVRGTCRSLPKTLAKWTDSFVRAVTSTSFIRDSD